MPVPEFTTVDEAWEDYRREVLEGLIDNPRMLTVLRRIFMAGALSAFTLMIEVKTPADVTKLESELMDYAKGP